MGPKTLHDVLMQSASLTVGGEKLRTALPAQMDGGLIRRAGLTAVVCEGAGKTGVGFLGACDGQSLAWQDECQGRRRIDAHEDAHARNRAASQTAKFPYSYKQCPNPDIPN